MLLWISVRTFEQFFRWYSNGSCYGAGSSGGYYNKKELGASVNRKIPQSAINCRFYLQWNRNFGFFAWYVSYRNEYRV